MIGASAPKLLPLRDELALYPAAPSEEGEPGWTIHDPSSNRFFRIGWLEMEMLLHWHVGGSAAVADAIARSTTLEPTADDVDQFALFLAHATLLRVSGDGAIARLTSMARKPSWVVWLIKNYLFFRIPLVRPDRFLSATVPLVGWVYTRTFLLLTMLAGLFGLYLTSRQWDVFLHTLTRFFSLEGAAQLALAVFLTKSLHELGHAYTAKRNGCRVPTIGVAFLVMWPVLYTDATEAWVITDNRKRLAIGAAGMLAELALAAYATLAWNLLPEGPVKAAVFLMATSSWVTTLGINLSPFMRFDGYYLLSDFLDIPNLQQRGFALARWQMRELLFGFGELPPEIFRPWKARAILLYAYGAWIYRFLLFVGIAAVVYGFFFKLLGIVLFAIEIGWFVVLPILTELKAWFMLRRRIRFNTHVLATGLVFVALVIGLFVPWTGTVISPAVIRAPRLTRIETTRGAILTAIHVAEGTLVASGSPLFDMRSSDLDHDAQSADLQVAVLKHESEVQSVSGEQLEEKRLVWQKLGEAQASLAGADAQRSELTLRAPFAGRVVDLASPLSVAETLPAKMQLATLVSTDLPIVEAYVPEADLYRVTIGSTARFVPEELDLSDLPARVTEIDYTAIKNLTQPVLASIAGGDIPVHSGPGNALVVDGAYYRVVLLLDAATDHAQSISNHIVRGHVRIDSARVSLAADLWRRARGILIRESGF